MKIIWHFSRSLCHFRVIPFLAFAFLSAAIVCFAEGRDEKGWEEISNSDGIRVLSREVLGSNIIAFRGIVTIDADIGVLVNIINDKTRHKEWVARLEENRTIEAGSPFESFEYTRVNCPWPVSDRDFVFRSTAEIDEGKGEVRMHLRSVSHPSTPPLNGVVRGELHQSIYILTRLPEGKTRVEVEFHGDPKGWVPVWVTNIFQRRWPVITLTGLRNQSAKPDIRQAYASYNSLKSYYMPLVAEQAGEKESRDQLQAIRKN